MSLTAFIAQYLHRTITAPGGIGGECVDAANQYMISVLHLAPVRANAVDWATASIPGCTWVENTPTNDPVMGDLVVWRESASAGIGVNGHIATVLLADVMQVLSADQNWNGQRTLEVVAHSYRGVHGWWHPVAYPLH